MKTLLGVYFILRSFSLAELTLSSGGTNKFKSLVAIFVPLIYIVSSSYEKLEGIK